MPDIVSLGAAKTYNPDTGEYTIPMGSVRRVVDPDDNTDAEDYGDLPIACALGVTALPAAADEATGAGAEGVVTEGVGGLNGAITAAWDTRCADVAGQMSPGDTALHGTHADNTKRSVFMAKEDLAAIIVGNDMVFTLDRGGEAITITAWGNTLQMTPDSVILSQGGVDGSPMSWIELKGGAISLVGAANVGGTTALPLVQSAGLITAIGVLAAAMTSIGGSPVTGTALGSALTTLAASIGTAATTKQITGA